MDNNIRMNLENIDGTVYECLIPPNEYEQIVAGNYDLANKYLMEAVEQKNRLLAMRMVLVERNNNNEKKNMVIEDEEDTRANRSFSEEIEYCPSPTNEDPGPSLSGTPSKDGWRYEAVLCLIASMHNHHDDLSHPKKKKHVYANLSNDLLSKGFQFEEKSCYNKWKSLLRSYKTTKDKKRLTGTGSSRFMFYNEMDEILGDKPSHSFGHTLESQEVDAINDIENENAGGGERELEAGEGTNNTGNLDGNGKKKRKSSYQAAKQKRHEERMEIENKKIKLETKKVDLLQKIIERL